MKKDISYNAAIFALALIVFLVTSKFKVWIPKGQKLYEVLDIVSIVFIIVTTGTMIKSLCNKKIKNSINFNKNRV